MMLKIKYISLLLILSIMLSACSNFDLLKKDTPVKAENPNDFSFSIDKIALSRSYQNTTPKVELINRNNKNSLLISAGLFRSSGVEILDLYREDSTITIQIKNIEDKSAQLVIPQIWIDISGISQSDLETMRFNILNENYTPLQISYGIVDVLNKLNSDMKISSSSSPSTELIQMGDKLIWDIKYQNIFDTFSKEIPLINLNVQVDSNTGSIISSNKSLISSLVDEGKIFDFIQDYGMLYVKDDSESSYLNNLWFYDFKEKTKEFYFGTDDQVISVKFSPDYKNISVITSDGSKNSLFIVQAKDKKVLYVNVLNDLSPRISIWKDKKEVFILGEPFNSSSKLALYNLDDNSINIENTFDYNLSSFRYYKDIYLLSELIPENTNNQLKISIDNSDFLNIGKGYMANIINKEYVAFLNKSENTDCNSIVIHNLKNPENNYTLDNNIINYQIISEEKILVIEKHNGGNDYSIYMLDLESKELQEIGKVNSNLVYLDYESELVYLDLVIPFQSEMSEIIYTIDMKHIK